MLEVLVGGLALRHPVMVGSGVLGDKPELIERLIVEGGPSAVVTKTLTKHSREGYLPPIVVELGCGSYLNAVGLANPGIGTVKDLVAVGLKYSVPIVVSVAGSSADEFAELASISESAGASAVELNLSCPHVRGLGAELGRDPRTAYDVVRSVRSITKIPVWVKLGPWDEVLEVAGRSLSAGADALVLVNTLRGMKIDVYSGRPILTARIGGLSGRALHPVAVRVVYEVYREFRCDIVGVGGVFDCESAVELLMAGARAVQVVSALIGNPPSVVGDIVRSMEGYMRELGFKSVCDIVGYAHRA